MIEFPRDFKEFLKLLNSKEIEYLIIGGYAVGFYGYPRATGDLDIWVPVDEKNALKLAEALRQFGFDLPDLNKEIFLTEKKSFAWAFRQCAWRFLHLLMVFTLKNAIKIVSSPFVYLSIIFFTSFFSLRYDR